MHFNNIYIKKTANLGTSRTLDASSTHGFSSCGAQREAVKGILQTSIIKTAKGNEILPPHHPKLENIY
jgi:hypothetical protein